MNLNLGRKISSTEGTPASRGKTPVEGDKEEDDFVENPPQVTSKINEGEEGENSVDPENGSPTENEEDSSVCVQARSIPTGNMS